MHSKNNRVNKNFQIAYFLAGSCHTPDGAYSLLKDLQEDREIALSQLEAGELRKQAKIIKAQRMIDTGEPDLVLEGQADLAEIKNSEKFSERNIKAAYEELDFINQCIEKIQPHRQFKELSDPEAHEAAQFDEWKLELIDRAENYLLTVGTIPTDHFTTMRQHPAFATEILPAINYARKLITTSPDNETVLNLLTKDRYDIPKLLEINQINLTALTAK